MLGSFSTSALLLAVLVATPAPSRAKPIDRPALRRLDAARRDLEDSSILQSRASSSNGTFADILGLEYAPPADCVQACTSLVDALEECNDDSCMCSQSGVNAYVSCAYCDTRLSMKHGVVNMTGTIGDLEAICQYENYTMTDITFASSPSSTATTTSSANTTADSPSTAFMLTSPYYASISIHSDVSPSTATLASLQQVRATLAPATVGDSATGAASRRRSGDSKNKATLHGLACWAGLVVGWVLLG